MRPLKAQPCGNPRCGDCRPPTQQLRMHGREGILRLHPLDCVRGYRIEGQRTAPQPESVPNRLWLLRSIPAHEGGSTHHSRRTAARYSVTRSVLYQSPGSMPTPVNVDSQMLRLSSTRLSSIVSLPDCIRVKCLYRNPAPQCQRWRHRTIAQNVANPQRINPSTALTRRKKFGPMRCGMKRTTTVSAANQVVKPTVAIRIPKPGVL